MGAWLLTFAACGWMASQYDVSLTSGGGLSREKNWDIPQMSSPLREGVSNESFIHIAVCFHCGRGWGYGSDSPVLLAHDGGGTPSLSLNVLGAPRLYQVVVVLAAKLLL